MRSLLAHLIQLRSTSDVEANRDQALRAIEDSGAAGADLVVLPEVMAWRGRQENEGSHAEDIPGPTTEALAQAARQAGVWLVGGSILERIPTSDRCYNTSCLFGPDGDLVARYRKIHLFDIDVPGQVSIRESDTRSPGCELVCVETPLGRIGMAVCYDLRFPELFRSLSEQGAEIVVMPSAFTLPTGRAHWHALIRARAIENQCFFLAPNQFGRSEHGFADYGHSLIVDPWGRILAEGPEDQAATVAAELDSAVLTKVRRDLPALTHRRLAAAQGGSASHAEAEE